MPDLEISNLTVLPEGSVAATDPLPIVDVSASETKKVTVKALIEAGAALIDDASIPGAKVGTLGTNQVVTAAIQNLAITTAKIADGAVTAVKITDATITGAKLVNNTITATQIAANAIGASELADDAVDTAAIANNAITNVKINNGEIVYAKLNISDGDIPGAKINGNSITSAQIAADAIGSSELADNSVDTAAIVNAAVTGAKIATDTIGSGNIAANAVGASELANNAVDTAAIVSNAITTAKIADDQVTAAKLADNLPGTILATGAIGSTQIAANAITDSELANNAVDAGAIASNAVTEAKIAANAVTTAKIADGTITPAKLNTSNLDRSINVASGNLGINNTVTAATRSGITYNAQGLITGTVALAASDLPLATTSAVGGVSVGTGLTVTGAGALSLSNSVTGATVSGITFNNQGQITAATGLVSANLPAATTSAKGAVAITSGGGLTVDGSGGLTTSTSGISAGTFTKLTVNNKGVATAGTTLSASDIPSLDAAKITTGSIAAARIGNDSIDGSKLSNTSTAIFQSIAQSGYPTAQFSGQILFDTVSEDAFIWDGNAWQAITTLTKGSLVFGGTYNANTSKMVSTTTAGIAAGLAVGSNLPTPSATTDGLYVVVDVAGTPSAPAPVVSLSPPDYILGVTNSGGSSWNEIDLSQTVAGQVASNITFTPYGQLSSTNVQDALQELETEKMGLAGGTCTGQLLISNTGSLVFEGSTVDAYELTLAVADPTLSDKTITFPDITGTVITSGDTNTVTSTMVDGSLLNANIAANAAIALSKLQAVSSAQIIVGNGSNVPTAVAVTGDIGINNAGLTSITAGAIVNADINASAAIAGSKITTGTTSAVGVLQLTDSAASTSTSTAATPAAVKVAKDAADAAATTANAALPKAGGTMTDNLIIDNGKELRLSESDSDGANYTGLKAQAQSGDITLTLPAVAPTANQVLKADASTPTTLTWAADSATDSTKMPLAGGTFTGDVTFTGDSTDGLWDKSASAFVANLTGNVTGNVTGNTSGSSGSCTGNAATATALATARNIGGVSFDGTANINLPGVNASGTQDTSGTAALATEFTVTANNSTDETVYPLFADGATGSQGAETDTGLTYNPSTGLLTSTSFAGNITGNVTGNCSGTSGGFTAGNASNLNSGTVAAAILGTGSSVTTKFLRGDNTWQTISVTPEGTAILSTGESGGTKFLREDGDGTCSWQTVATGVSSDAQYNTLGGTNAGDTIASGGTNNTLFGYDAGTDITTSDNNAFFGYKAGENSLGSDNTFIGVSAGANNSWGDDNIAIGKNAFSTVTNSGNGNIAIGEQALDSQEASIARTVAIGAWAGKNNYGGGEQVFIGRSCGEYNRGDGNIAIGQTCLSGATSGTHSSDFNVGIGHYVGRYIAGGDYNVLLGWYAGNALTDSDNNILIGKEAGTDLAGQYANDNVVLGFEAMKASTASYENIAIGRRAIYSGTGGSRNVGIGTDAMAAVTSGQFNIGIGGSAGGNLRTGQRNIHLGYASYGASTGADNISLGHSSMTASVTGNQNIALGKTAGYSLTSGSDNYGIGTGSLYTLTTGSNNISFGYYAGQGITTGSQNTCIGRQACNDLTTGSDNLCIGDYAGDSLTTGSNNTCIGHDALPSSATVSNEITLGSTNVTKFRIPGINFVLKDNGGTPSSGQVLTADGSGEGYWAAAGVAADANGNVQFGGANSTNLASSGSEPAGNFFAGYEVADTVVDTDNVSYNVGIGYRALKSIDYYGRYNTAIGYEAGMSIPSSDGNTCLGYQAGRSTTGGHNTFIGRNAGNSGTNNITSGSNNILIGRNATATSATVSNECTIGAPWNDGSKISKFRIPGCSFEVTNTDGISDGIGPVRSIPKSTENSAYTLVAGINGRAIYTSYGVTVPNNVMSSGMAVTIVSNSGSDQTITQGSGLTMYFAADGTTGNRTLASRGIATIWFADASTAYISGAGLS